MGFRAFVESRMGEGAAPDHYVIPEFEDGSGEIPYQSDLWGTYSDMLAAGGYDVDTYNRMPPEKRWQVLQLLRTAPLGQGRPVIAQRDRPGLEQVFNGIGQMQADRVAPEGFREMLTGLFGSRSPDPVSESQIRRRAR